MPVTMKTLKKENAGLRTQVEALMTQIKNLQAKVDGTMANESSQASTPPCSSAIEQSKILEFIGLECDDLNNFRASVLQEISAIKSNLEKNAYQLFFIIHLLQVKKVFCWFFSLFKPFQF